MRFYCTLTGPISGLNCEILLCICKLYTESPQYPLRSGVPICIEVPYI